MTCESISTGIEYGKHVKFYKTMYTKWDPRSKGPLFIPTHTIIKTDKSSKTIGVHQSDKFLGKSLIGIINDNHLTLHANILLWSSFPTYVGLPHPVIALLFYRFHTEAKKLGPGPPFNNEAPIMRPMYLNVCYVSAAILCTGTRAVSGSQNNELFLEISPSNKWKNSCKGTHRWY